MLLFGKQLEEITETDLIGLIGLEREVKTLDFKVELPSGNQKSKKDFLADISAFANASGGHIIYGIAEEAGKAITLEGLIVGDIDAEILRLNSMTDASIKPRIPALIFHPIELSNARYVVIARIPKSWLAPHVVEIETNWRFYSRNSAGNYPLDIIEVRNSFNASATTREQIGNFRSERLANIIAGETPVPLEPFPKIILHILPYNYRDSNISVDFKELERDNAVVGGWYSGHYFNFDGLLFHRTPPQETYSRTYWQVFRDGRVEYMDVLTSSSEDTMINLMSCELDMVVSINNTLRFYRKYGIPSPIIILISFLGIKGFEISIPNDIGTQIERNRLQPIPRINKSQLLLPDVMMIEATEKVEYFMKPIFDILWNAWGWPRSLSYDKTGTWVHKIPNNT